MRLTRRSWQLFKPGWRGLLVAALLVLFVGHAFHFWRFQAITWVERGWQDWRAQRQAPANVHRDVVILDVDERSLAELGRWPWQRDTLAKVVDVLFGPQCTGLKALGLDVLLAEPDPHPEADARLAQSLSRCPTVLGWYLSGREDAHTTGSLPIPLLLPDDVQGFAWPQDRWRGYSASLPAFDAVAASGLINGLIDEDGKNRRVPVFMVHQQHVYESLALSVWRSTLPPHVARLGPPPNANRSAGYAEYLDIVMADPSPTPSVRIPLDAQGGMGVVWRGPGLRDGGAFDYLSITDVVHGRIPAERWVGKIGLIGSSSPGLMDLRATPVHAAFPGVEIHALALASLLDRQFLSTPPYAAGWELAMLCLLALGGVWGLQRLRPAPALAVTLLLALGLLAAAEALRWSRGWVMPVATPLLLLCALFLLYNVWGYWSESRSKREFAALFGQYVPPQLVEKMAANPTRYSMAPRKAELTILFSDVRGFTSISEQLSPDDLREFINQYLTAMSDCIASREGTLDKFIGDAVMAFWGAPVEQPEHADRAVDAALRMLDTCRSLSEAFVARGWPPLAIGIGLNTGDVRVGDMGSNTRRAYTVMGDPVNLASRLESLTKRYGLGLLVGEATMTNVSNVHWLLVDRVRVKGKELPARIYTPVRPWPQDPNTLERFCADWQIFQDHYVQGDWPGALACMQKLNAQTTTIDRLQIEPLIALYAQRLDALKANAPQPGWQGITDFDEK